MAWHEIGSAPGYLAEVDIVGNSCRGIRCRNDLPDQWIIVKVKHVTDGREFRLALAPNSGLTTRNFTGVERNQITVNLVPNPEDLSLTLWEIPNWHLTVNILRVGLLPQDSGV